MMSRRIWGWMIRELFNDDGGGGTQCQITDLATPNPPHLLLLHLLLRRSSISFLLRPRPNSTTGTPILCSMNLTYFFMFGGSSENPFARIFSILFGSISSQPLRVAYFGSHP